MHTNIETLIGTVAQLEKKFQAKLREHSNWQLFKVTHVHTPSTEDGKVDIKNVVLAWTIVIPTQ